MAEIPQAVLSEAFQDRMKGRRLVSAVFTTFRFEPGFFETEVLPVFLDIPLSHAAAIKLVQLEDAIKTVPGSIAVYYDSHGLVADGGAKLDVRRFPIRHRTGIFHPKNVLVLVEDAEPDAEGNRVRALLCACLSANLTRAGWWENVEVAHIEEIAARDRTSLRDSMLAYADELVRAVEQGRPNDELRERHLALRDIREFLREETSQRERRSVDGRLHTHFDNGQTSLVNFIQDVAGSSLKGMCLEVISPYFDEAAESKPLSALIEAFEPAQVRMYLPLNDAGAGLCDSKLYEWVRTRPDVVWGVLPKDLLKRGKAEEVKHRTVHAKVYRFFEPKRGGREVVYVGSTNLTQAGCRQPASGSLGPVPGNWETGFLVEATSGGRPDWWLSGKASRPMAFAPRGEDEGTASAGGTPLSLRYWWDRKEAEAIWAGTNASPVLRVEHAGATVLTLPSLQPREWQRLDAADSARLEQTLLSSSLLQVCGEGREPGLLLVQEEGMAHRPSVLLELSAADILRYWALLTVEQRAAFIEGHAMSSDDDNPLAAKVAALRVEPTLFDQFAGVFHAFECVRERVKHALDEDRAREADYRLFGKKYDSFGTLLARVVAGVKASTGDRVEHYVVGLCAKQLFKELAREFPEYWRSHDHDVKTLRAQLDEVLSVREAIAAEHAEMPAFLSWFDGWFVKRAEPVPEVEP